VTAGVQQESLEATEPAASPAAAALRSSGPRGLLVAALVVVNLPIAVVTVRALARVVTPRRPAGVPGPEAPLYAVVTMTTSLIAVACTAAVLVGGGAWAARHDHRALVAMNVMAGLALVTGYVALATAPVDVVAVAVHQMRWLWPLAAFVSATVLATLVSLLLDLLAGREIARRAVLAVGGVAAVAIAVATLPTHTSQAPGPLDSIEHAERRPSS
jgi:hypothetical protein